MVKKRGYNLGKMCIDCGTPISNKSTRCRICSNSGKNNPAYKHGRCKDYSKDKHCLNCGKLISNKATYCQACMNINIVNHTIRTWVTNTRGREYIIGYAIWKKEVFERDNYTCQHCQVKENLHCHHIESYHSHEDLRINIDNGITLCQICHKKLHFLFNEPTAKQLEWYFNNVK